MKIADLLIFPRSGLSGRRLRENDKGESIWREARRFPRTKNAESVSPREPVGKCPALHEYSSTGFEDPG